MKKQFMIGIFLSFFLLIITPSIPAMEFTIVKESYENILQSEIKKFSKDKIDHLSNLIQKKNNKFSSLFLEDINLANDSLWFLFLLTVYLILYLFFKAIPNFIINTIKFISTMTSNLWIFLKNFLILIYDVIFFSVYSLGQMIIKFFQGFGFVTYNLIVISFNLIISIITGFGKLIERIWQGLGTFIGLILDIIRLIYETVFPNQI
jgi:hypothetical protein